MALWQYILAKRPSVGILRGPLRLNRKVVDMVFASTDENNRTAHVIGIQITVSKQRKDAGAAFFVELDRRYPELGNFKVETSFLWITGEIEIELK